MCKSYLFSLQTSPCHELKKKDALGASEKLSTFCGKVYCSYYCVHIAVQGGDK